MQYIPRLIDDMIETCLGVFGQTPLHFPDLMIVVTATGLAYRDDDVLVIPLTTLRP